MAQVHLLEIAHARSGDKGNGSNVGVIARHSDVYPFLGTVSLKLDAQGKTHASLLLRLKIDVPDELLKKVRNSPNHAPKTTS